MGVFASEPLGVFLDLFYEGVPFVGILWEEVSLDAFRWQKDKIPDNRNPIFL